MPTLALLSAVNILLQSDCQIFAFSARQLNLEPSHFNGNNDPAGLSRQSFAPFTFGLLTALRILMGQVVADPTDEGLTSVWHCNTSCKTWCANAQCVQEAVIPRVNFVCVSHDFWKATEEMGQAWQARRHHCVSLIREVC